MGLRLQRGLGTFQCVLATKQFDFKSALSWGTRTCRAYAGMSAVAMSVQDVFRGAKLYETLTRQGASLPDLVELRRLLLECAAVRFVSHCVRAASGLDVHNVT